MRSRRRSHGWMSRTRARSPARSSAVHPAPTSPRPPPASVATRASSCGRTAARSAERGSITAPGCCSPTSLPLRVEEARTTPDRLRVRQRRRGRVARRPASGCVRVVERSVRRRRRLRSCDRGRERRRGSRARRPGRPARPAGGCLGILHRPEPAVPFGCGRHGPARATALHGCRPCPASGRAAVVRLGTRHCDTAPCSSEWSGRPSRSPGTRSSP